MLCAERISDTAIHHRLKTCVPWVKALLSRMLGRRRLLEGHRRFLIAEGSTVQGLGSGGSRLQPKAPMWIDQNTSASRVINESAPASIRARCVIVSGSTLSMKNSAQTSLF